MFGCQEKASPKDTLELSSLRQELEKERRIRSEYEDANRRMIQLLEEAESEAKDHLKKWQVEGLRRQGLNNPVLELRNSLKEQTQFLPPPSNKGLSFFFEAEETRFLQPNFAWVFYTEGHYGGWMLLEYRIQDGRITWTKLWSESDR
jgi:hypothetical protein